MTYRRSDPSLILHLFTLSVLHLIRTRGAPLDDLQAHEVIARIGVPRSDGREFRLQALDKAVDRRDRVKPVAFAGRPFLKAPMHPTALEPGYPLTGQRRIGGLDAGRHPCDDRISGARPFLQPVLAPARNDEVP